MKLLRQGGKYGINGNWNIIFNFHMRYFTNFRKIVVFRNKFDLSYFKKELVMLILTRRVGESIIINDNISVVVLGVKGQQVRIGVNAPEEVKVHREEIYDRIHLENLSKEGDSNEF